MSIDRLRTVKWAASQLGHTDYRSTYAWLKRNRVPVFRGRFSERAFFEVFARQPDKGSALMQIVHRNIDRQMDERQKKRLVDLQRAREARS